jgi:hypothetical protein
MHALFGLVLLDMSAYQIPKFDHESAHMDCLTYDYVSVR